MKGIEIMEERFYKEISVFGKSGNEHELIVTGEAYISPAEYDYGWNHQMYEIPADFEVRNIESVCIVRHNTSKRREDIPNFAKMVKSRFLKS